MQSSSNPRRSRRAVAVAKAVAAPGPLRMEWPERFLWTLLVLLLAAFLIAGPARAAESPTQLDLPKPALLLSPDSISFAVVHARREDEGFQSLLNTAWQAMKQANSGATTGFMGILLRVIQGDQSNGLISFLPLQMVRVDSMDPETGEPHPTVAVTVSGWGGLQTPLYMMMSRDKDGKPYPTQDLEDATLVLREGWKDPTRSHVLTRIKGTFVSFPSVERAQSAVKALASGNPAGKSGEIGDLLSGIDAERDTYGVLLNRRGSLLKFLSWLNKSDMARAQSVVGQERMQEVVSQVSSMTWEGDLVSDNEMSFYLVFRTASPEARKDLAALLKDVREVLDQYGRAGEMKITGIGSDLEVDFTMVGYREMVTNYIGSTLN